MAQGQTKMDGAQIVTLVESPLVNANIKSLVPSGLLPRKRLGRTGYHGAGEVVRVDDEDTGELDPKYWKHSLLWPLNNLSHLLLIPNTTLKPHKLRNYVGLGASIRKKCISDAQWRNIVEVVPQDVRFAIEYAKAEDKSLMRFDIELEGGDFATVDGNGNEVEQQTTDGLILPSSNQITQEPQPDTSTDSARDVTADAGSLVGLPFKDAVPDEVKQHHPQLESVRYYLVPGSCAEAAIEVKHEDDTNSENNLPDDPHSPEYQFARSQLIHGIRLLLCGKGLAGIVKTKRLEHIAVDENDYPLGVAHYVLDDFDNDFLEAIAGYLSLGTDSPSVDRLQRLRKCLESAIHLRKGLPGTLEKYEWAILPQDFHVARQIYQQPDNSAASIAVPIARRDGKPCKVIRAFGKPGQELWHLEHKEEEEQVVDFMDTDTDSISAVPDDLEACSDVDDMESLQSDDPIASREASPMDSTMALLFSASISNTASSGISLDAQTIAPEAADHAEAMALYRREVPPSIDIPNADEQGGAGEGTGDSTPEADDSNDGNAPATDSTIQPPVDGTVYDFSTSGITFFGTDARRLTELGGSIDHEQPVRKMPFTFLPRQPRERRTRFCPLAFYFNKEDNFEQILPKVNAALSDLTSLEPITGDDATMLIIKHGHIVTKAIPHFIKHSSRSYRKYFSVAKVSNGEAEETEAEESESSVKMPLRLIPRCKKAARPAKRVLVESSDQVITT